MNDINHTRKLIYENYYETLKPLAERGLLELTFIPEDCKSNYHMFYIMLKDSHQRTNLIEYLKRHNIQAVFHYVPLHSSPMGQQFGYQFGMLPITEDVSERLLRLPFYYELSIEDINYICKEISNFISLY